MAIHFMVKDIKYSRILKYHAALFKNVVDSSLYSDAKMYMEVKKANVDQCG